jgi:hypothetical protein
VKRPRVEVRIDRRAHLAREQSACGNVQIREPLGGWIMPVGLGNRTEFSGAHVINIPFIDKPTAHSNLQTLRIY